MCDLLDAERATYRDIWTGVPAYAAHSPGVEVLPIFLDLVGDERGDVLDAGTGSGKGALALTAAGFDVVCCDVTDAGLVPEARALPFRSACLWHRLDFDGEWAYCTDVLEHLPTQFTMLAVYRMLRVVTRGVFVSVSLVPDVFGAWVGTSLHQTVQPFLWWKDSLNQVGRVTDARDLLTSATFYVVPR